MNLQTAFYRLEYETHLFFHRLMEKRASRKSLEKRQELQICGDNGLRHIEYFSSKTILLLGRFSKLSIFNNHLNLAQYGARELGVSRVHAEIQLLDNCFYLSDLNSTNGTYIDGMQLEPNQPELLNSGADIELGDMHIQVCFKAS